MLEQREVFDQEGFLQEALDEEALLEVVAGGQADRLLLYEKILLDKAFHLGRFLHDCRE